MNKMLIQKLLSLSRVYLIIGALSLLQGCSEAAEKASQDSKQNGDLITVKRVGNDFVVGNNSQGQADALAKGLGEYDNLYKHFSIGRELTKQSKFDEAEAEFMMLINGVNGKKDVGMGHIGLLEVYEAKGNYAKAILECEYMTTHAAEFARPKYEAKLTELKSKAVQQNQQPTQP